MSENQSAVEKLLIAETNAHKMIGGAQKEREKKIKEAKIQASDEILVYRKEKETEHQQLIAQVILIQLEIREQQRGESGTC